MRHQTVHRRTINVNQRRGPGVGQTCSKCATCVTLGSDVLDCVGQFSVWWAELCYAGFAYDCTELHLH